MRSTFNSLLALSLLLLLGNFTVQAQLIVDGATDGEGLAEVLIGEGVDVFNVVLNCPDGAFGTFNGEATNLNMAEGILLTSGQIDIAASPNDNGGAGVDNFAPGDADLDALPATLGTNDACVLEFDFIPFSDNISFQYIFGSEEYLEFVDQYNDVFAFYISGPGFATPTNIATIPGTTTEVSINSLNDIDASEFYVDNGSGFPTDPNSTVQYDGFTTVLTADADVTPCEEYHLKIVIADDLDGVYDSGVFLAANSLSTDFVEVTAAAVSTTSAGFDNAVEGCVNAIFNFAATNTLSEDLTLTFELGGDAVEGEDYEALDHTIVIDAETGEASVVINVLEDGVDEGPEVIELNFELELGCDTSIFQSASIIIEDVVEVEVSASETVIQPGQNVQLFATGGSGSYTWAPTFGLSNSSIADPFALPLETTTYTATSIVGDCEISASVEIVVETCSPETDGVAGQVILDKEFVCDGDAVMATSPSSVLFLEDAQAYYLHNSPDSDLGMDGFILYDANLSGVFNNGDFPTNEELYVTTIVADDDGTGFPDLNDPCISISPATPFVFLVEVKFSLDEVCDWEFTGDYTVTGTVIGGLPQYDSNFTYLVAGDVLGEFAYGESFQVIFPEGVTTQYSFEVITDQAGCTANIGKEFVCYKTPIELIAFTGEVLIEGNNLKWYTATETDNDFFTLSRSTNGIDFVEIAQIDGAGTSSEAQIYTYLDKEAPNGLAYYHLAQTDVNGSTSESFNIVSLSRGENSVQGVQITNLLPVPANNFIEVSFTAARDLPIQINLYNVNGQLIWENTQIANTNSNNFVIPLENAASGMYFLTLSDGQNHTSQKFLKN